MDFEWDDRKARENIAKHGVSFDLATWVFEDPELVLAEDMVHSRTETRYFAFGRVRGDVLTGSLHRPRRPRPHHRCRVLEKGQGVL